MLESITIFDAILDATIDRLMVAPALAGGQIEDDTDGDVMPEDVDQRIVVSVERASAQDHTANGAVQMWTTLLRLDIHARRDDRSTAPQVGRRSRPVMALAQQAHQRLMEDDTLGGQVLRLELQQMNTDREIADTTLGALTLLYRVQHVAAGNSLAQPTFA